MKMKDFFGLAVIGICIALMLILLGVSIRDDSISKEVGRQIMLEGENVRQVAITPSDCVDLGFVRSIDHPTAERRILGIGGAIDKLKAVVSRKGGDTVFVVNMVGDRYGCILYAEGEAYKCSK